jgi:hypothetical protein
VLRMEGGARISARNSENQSTSRTGRRRSREHVHHEQGDDGEEEKAGTAPRPSLVLPGVEICGTN